MALGEITKLRGSPNSLGCILKGTWNNATYRLHLSDSVWLGLLLLILQMSSLSVADCAYLVQTTLEAWQAEKRTQEFLSLPNRWAAKSRKEGWTRQKDLHISCQIQESQKKSINCHANEKQMRFKSDQDKGGAKKVSAQECFFLYVILCIHLCATISHASMQSFVPLTIG